MARCCLPRLLSATQIDYSTVFFFEYFGPMVIYPLFFFLPQIFYGTCVTCVRACVRCDSDWLSLRMRRPWCGTSGC